MANNVYLLTLTSGVTVITCAVDENETTMLLKDALEVTFDNSNPGVELFYLSRWNPFSDNYLTLVYKSAIESLVKCSDRFTNMYNSKLQVFTSSATQVEDGDVTVVTDASGEEEEQEVYIEGEDEIEDKKIPITYH